MMADNLLMAETAYLFIDGAYLRESYDQAIRRVFGSATEGNLDLYKTVDWLRKPSPYIIRRVFYYDCLQDIRKERESEEEFKLKVEKQQARFDQIQALRGFHVRLGSLSGSAKKIRQKKVDVSLAVDALDHAFRKNMAGCYLLAGDLDFAPLVESLVRLGTWVEVVYDPRSAAKELYKAADGSYPLNFNTYYDHFSAGVFQKTCLVPSTTGGIRKSKLFLLTRTSPFWKATSTRLLEN
jgi:uncharacterized LabA/DUF88 family protein